MGLSSTVENALQQKTLTASDAKRKSVAYIFMNVKGRDLLSIDEPNDQLDNADHAMYASMGLARVRQLGLS